MSDPLEAMVLNAVETGMPPPIPAGGVTPDMSLGADLSIDSIGLMGICFIIDQEVRDDLFDYADELTEATTVADIIRVTRKANE